MTDVHLGELSARERERIVVDTIARGGTFTEAAEDAGYTDRSTAYRAWRRVLDRMPVVDGKPLRQLLLTRHEMAFKLAWNIADDAEQKPMVRLAALDRCRATLAEVAKIAGSYAPVEQRLTVISEDSIDAAMAALIEQFPEVEAGFVAPEDREPEPAEAGDRGLSAAPS